MNKYIIPILAFGLLAVCATGCKGNKAGDGDAAFDPMQPETLGDGFIDGEGAMLPGGSFDEGRTRFEAPAGIGDPVYFAYNQSSIGPGEAGKIAAVAQFLLQNGDVAVQVEGNCDERGTNEYNLSLGEFRAQAVRDQLINSGVAADRVYTISYGEDKPAVAGHDESAWAANRRADFSFAR